MTYRSVFSKKLSRHRKNYVQFLENLQLFQVLIDICNISIIHRRLFNYYFFIYYNIVRLVLPFTTNCSIDPSQLLFYLKNKNKEIQQYEITKIKIRITNSILNITFGGINDRSCSVIHDKSSKATNTIISVITPNQVQQNCQGNTRANQTFNIKYNQRDVQITVQQGN